jgi:hypothetical protein
MAVMTDTIDLLITVLVWMLIPACFIAKYFADRQSERARREFDALFEIRRRQLVDAKLEALMALRGRKKLL